MMMMPPLLLIWRHSLYLAVVGPSWLVKFLQTHRSNGQLSATDMIQCVDTESASSQFIHHPKLCVSPKCVNHY